MILNLLSHKHGIYLHLFRLSLVLFNTFLTVLSVKVFSEPHSQGEMYLIFDTLFSQHP